MLKQLIRKLRGQTDGSPPVYVGSHEDRLSRIRPMHVDPDDDQPTREDKEAEKAARRAGGSGGGPAIF
jgi:hypothetical protein